jgi:biopolymer transport protein ExbD
VKALAELMAQIKGKFPDKTDATILAQADTSYDTLVQVMDAVRAGHTVQGAKVVPADLFPDISIGDAPIPK